MTQNLRINTAGNITAPSLQFHTSHRHPSNFTSAKPEHQPSLPQLLPTLAVASSLLAQCSGQQQRRIRHIGRRVGANVTPLAAQVGGRNGGDLSCNFAIPNGFRAKRRQEIC
jgi:hypothetical protein